MKNIPATKPSFSKNDINFINKHFKEILNGKSYLSQFKYSAQFEEEFASYVGTSFGVSCNSGTSALELIFRGLNVVGREVILPSNTFIATANAIMNAGGLPVFADCDDTMCLDYDDVLQKINKNTVGICHVHIGGLVSDSALKLSRYCKDNGLYFVEDAAQAHGSSNQGVSAGTLGDAAGFSFYSTKVMTTGEGGIVTTNNKKLVEKMKSSREFGKEKKGIFTNYHTRMGYNWRMPEVSALMGIRQLKSIESFIQKRHHIASVYDSYLDNCKHITIIKPSENSRFNFFKYTIILKNFDRVVFHNAMEKRGVQLSGYVYELPLHKQPVFPNHNDISLPNSEKLCSTHVCLPIYPLLNEAEAEYVAQNVLDIFDES